MADRPIIFSAPMVQALLAGRKTQTRRIINPQPTDEAVADGSFVANANRLIRPAPIRYAVGDRLYVREAWHTNSSEDGKPPSEIDEGEFIWYVADGEGGMPISRMRPSIHMPRWASRLTLLVTEVRVQRLQDISEEDARAEGCFVGKASGRVFENEAGMHFGGPQWTSARDWYADLWDTIHGADAWSANPWVVAVSFTAHLGNIDALPVAA